ncbi:hypothetical protein, partial [Kibdelosporangium philippinense]|uniref:hypothetical protein n=1 Tax=Kibdelosporangium philippinense TaxID=211113 RepID=UPI0035E90A61
SGLFTSARNSARSSAVNSMPTANTITSHTNVKQTESHDTSCGLAVISPGVHSANWFQLCFRLGFSFQPGC